MAELFLLKCAQKAGRFSQSAAFIFVFIFEPVTYVNTNISSLFHVFCRFIAILYHKYSNKSRVFIYLYKKPKYTNKRVRKNDSPSLVLI